MMVNVATRLIAPLHLRDMKKSEHLCIKFILDLLLLGNRYSKVKSKKAKVKRNSNYIMLNISDDFITFGNIV